MSDVRKVQSISTKPIIYSLLHEDGSPVATAFALRDMRAVNCELKNYATDINKKHRTEIGKIQLVDLRNKSVVVYHFHNGSFQPNLF